MSHRSILAIGSTAARKPASPLAELPSGKVQLKSAGALAFGPDGILFVGDSVGGAVVAIDTGDRKRPLPPRRSTFRASMKKSPRWWA